jgi:hypothetical protein
MKDYQPIGQMLIQKGRITPEQLDSAISQRKNYHQRIGEFLISLGYVTENDIAECLAEQFGFEMIDPAQITPDQDALQVVDPEFALAHRILPVRNTEDLFECVVADPIDVPTTDTISRLVNKHTVFYIAPVSALLSAIRKVYGLTESITTDKKKHTGEHAKKRMLQPDRDELLSTIDEEIRQMYKHHHLKLSTAARH